MILKNLLNTNLKFIIPAIAIVVASCQGGNKQANKEQSKADSANVKEISQDVKDVVYPLPTPFEITKILNNIGASYISASLNPTGNAEKYFTEKSKALNLGVYGADLAYAATYDQKQDVNLYSKSLKTLIDELGIKIDYSKFLSDEFKSNVNNKDSLTNIITRTYYDTYKTLKEKNNPDLAVMMVSGMWVELMYIATNISKDTYRNPGIVKLIVNQKTSYTKLLELLASRDKNPDIKLIETKLLTLKPIFDNINSGLLEKDYLTILQTIQSVRKSFIS